MKHYLSVLFESKSFNLFLLMLIIVSVVSYSIETLPNLSTRVTEILFALEVIIVVLFSIEYLCRFYSSEKPLKFVFSFYGIIDLLAIIPFFLMTTMDLRSLRLLRLLRLISALKLLKYTSALDRFTKAISESRYELVVFSLASLIIIFIAAVGIFHFEHEAQPMVFRSMFDSLWWAVASLTTVGYGDIYPVTLGGKIFTFFILMVGLGLVAVPTGIIAGALSRHPN